MGQCYVGHADVPYSTLKATFSLKMSLSRVILRHFPDRYLYGVVTQVSHWLPW
jgi:hypothetical protein